MKKYKNKKKEREKKILKINSSWLQLLYLFFFKFRSQINIFAI